MIDWTVDDDYDDYDDDDDDDDEENQDLWTRQDVKIGRLQYIYI